MYPDNGSFNYSGVLAGLGAAIGSAFQTQPSVYSQPGVVGYAPYNYGAGGGFVNPYTGIQAPVANGINFGFGPNGIAVTPTLLDTYNQNSGLFSGTTGIILLVVGLVLVVTLVK